MSAVSAIRRVLTIAGSDSGGGAGIQADLKTFARCGVHGMTAITAVTAQNTRGVDAIHPVPPAMIVAQIRSVAADIGIDAIKIGMLGSADAIAAVAGCLLQLPPGLPIVVDPVLVATCGKRLLDTEAVGALVALIVPLATVLTPNLPEALELAGAARGGSPTDALTARAGDGAADSARALHRLGAAWVIVTGGHRPGRADLVYDGREITELSGTRHAGGASHGSGCTHSAVMAAQLALGVPVLEAAGCARALTADAVRDGFAELGDGEGPVDVFGGQRTRRPS